MTARAWKEAAGARACKEAGRIEELKGTLLQSDDLETVQVIDTEFTKVDAVFVRDSVRNRMEGQISGERESLIANPTCWTSCVILSRFCANGKLEV